jgi:hypothetical protein
VSKRRPVRFWGWRGAPSGLRQDARAEPGARTPMTQRWPVAVSIAASIFIAEISSHDRWIRVGVVVGVLVLCALFLRLAVGWPWSRILRYREPQQAPGESRSRKPPPQ